MWEQKNGRLRSMKNKQMLVIDYRWIQCVYSTSRNKKSPPHNCLNEV
jgi:hypothetical protein